MIVLHATADRGNEQASERWLAAPGSGVSAHLLIRRDGSVTRLVPDQRRAWHAGHGSWPGVKDVNSASLGWEIANKNDGREPYTDAQYRTVANLLRHYLPQGLQRSDVLGHAMVDPGRKTDPNGWQWDRMWREYEGLNVPPVDPDVTRPVEDAPLTAEVTPPNLKSIIVPGPEHVEEAIRVREDWTPDSVRDGIELVEVILRGMQAAGVKHNSTKLAADALSTWLKLTDDE